MPDMTYEEARRFFDYDPETGRVTWNDAGFWTKKYPKGSFVSAHDPGHVYVDSKKFRRAKIIWLWMTGEDAPGFIYFADLDRENFRWNNLTLKPTRAGYSQRMSRRAQDSQEDPRILIEYPPLHRNENIHKYGRGHLIVTPYAPVYNMGDPSPMRSALYMKTGRI